MAKYEHEDQIPCDSECQNVTHEPISVCGPEDADNAIVEPRFTDDYGKPTTADYEYEDQLDLVGDECDITVCDVDGDNFQVKGSPLQVGFSSKPKDGRWVVRGRLNGILLELVQSTQPVVWDRSWTLTITDETEAVATTNETSGNPAINLKAADGVYLDGGEQWPFSPCPVILNYPSTAELDIQFTWATGWEDLPQTTPIFQVVLQAIAKIAYTLSISEWSGTATVTQDDIQGTGILETAGGIVDPTVCIAEILPCGAFIEPCSWFPSSNWHYLGACDSPLKCRMHVITYAIAKEFAGAHGAVYTNAPFPVTDENWNEVVANPFGPWV